MNQEQLAAFLAQAERQWDSTTSLRAKEALIESVRYDRHGDLITLPESLTADGRAAPVFSSKCREKLTRAKALLIEDDPLVVVAQQGISGRAQLDRERIQGWLTAALRLVGLIGPAVERSPADMVYEDLLVRSRAWVQVLPNPGVWSSLEAEAERSPYQIDETRLRRSRFPIKARWCPARSVVPVFDLDGLAEVWEYQEMPVRAVLDSYVDEDGKSLAKQLAETVRQEGVGEYRAGLTPNDVVTVVTHATRTEMTIALLPRRMSGMGEEARQDYTQRGDEEVLWQGEHGMWVPNVGPVVPYAYFPGRISVADDDVLKYEGFLDPIVGKVIDLDNAMSQLATSVRLASWASLVIEKPADGIGTGDRPEDFTVPEGGVSDALGPGEKLVNPNWLNSGDFQWHQTYITLLKQEIDFNTLGMSAYGTDAVNSGYLQAQLQAATESVLRPFEQGASKGWTRVCELMLAAACLLLQEDGIDEVPVRVVGREGQKYISLDKRLLSTDFDVDVIVKARPVGGEAALVQTLVQMQQAGYITQDMAMERLNLRNIGQIKRRNFADKILNGPELQQAFAQSLVAYVAQAMQAAQTPNLPDNLMLPESMAGVLQSPEARSRLPDQTDMNGASDVGLGGLPNLAAEAYNPAGPAAPTQGERFRLENVTHRGLSGSPFGQAQIAPGGYAHMNEINERSA